MRILLMIAFIACASPLYGQSGATGSVTASGSQLKSGTSAVSYSVGEIIVPLNKTDKASVKQGITAIAADALSIKKLKDKFSADIDIQVFPNPFSSTLIATIGSNNYQQLEWTIFDVSGRILSREVIAGNEQRITINTSNWMTGHYLMTVSERNGRLIGTYQIIKQL
jgi:hypothetical protein